MKRASFPFPTVPNTPEDARIYANSAAKRGKMLGKLYAKLLSQRGFVKGRILDAGCGSGEVLIELTRAFPEKELFCLSLSGQRADEVMVKFSSKRH